MCGLNSKKYKIFNKTTPTDEITCKRFSYMLTWLKASIIFIIVIYQKEVRELCGYVTE